MKAWSVKYQSFNKKDYIETVSGRDELEARKNAKKAIYRKDDRDVIISVKEDTSLSNWH